MASVEHRPGQLLNLVNWGAIGQPLGDGLQQIAVTEGRGLLGQDFALDELCYQRIQVRGLDAVAVEQGLQDGAVEAQQLRPAAPGAP